MEMEDACSDVGLGRAFISCITLGVVVGKTISETPLEMVYP